MPSHCAQYLLLDPATSQHQFTITEREIGPGVEVTERSFVTFQLAVRNARDGLTVRTESVCHSHLNVLLYPYQSFSIPLFISTRLKRWYLVSRNDSLYSDIFPEQRQGVYAGLIGMRVGGTRRVELPASSRADCGSIQGIPDDVGHIVGSLCLVMVSLPLC